MAGAFFGVEIEVFMVKISYQQNPYRRHLMEAYGGIVHASPTNLTDAGRSILARDPESSGSQGLAISEALEACEAGQERVILFNLSGHGHFDMSSYASYFSGMLEDYEYPAEAVLAAQQHLPQIPGR